MNVDWERVARLVLTSRLIDEFQEQELAPSGSIPYQFSAKGHELSQVLLGLAMNHPHDAAAVYYRTRPFMLACGLAPREVFAADLARTGSPSEGRDVGVVFSLPPRQGPTVLPASGDVGAQYTPAAGWAQAITYYQHVLQERSWMGAMAAALGGDGSVAANGFWSALTMATTLELPLLLYIEDNGYGISVPRHYQTPGGDIAANLRSFGNLKVLSGSGTEPLEAAGLIAQAVAHIRGGNGACLLHLQVPRLTGHTYGEDQSAYRTVDEIEQDQSRDPVLCLKEHLGERVDWQSLHEQVRQEIAAAYREASGNPAPASSQVRRHLFYDGVEPQVPASRAVPPLVFTGRKDEGQEARVNFLDAVRTVMAAELERNPKLLIFGEDVGQRGGVHRATLDLQARFGARRVFDTSLSEEGIAGRSIGLALAGLTPLAEIQFRKYTDPATEQINDAGWIRWRTAGKFGAHIVIRIPVGHSRRTGDPWHSVSGEAIFAHTLGWRVAFPSNAADAAGLLRAALRGHDPVLFLEHRALLDSSKARRPYPGDEYSVPFGQAAVLQEGRWLTLVTWGEMVYRCLEAAEGFDGQVEVLDLRTIIPWDREKVLESVRKTGKCLVVHEDTMTAGFAGEIVATLAEHAFTDLDAPVGRVATADHPIPYNRDLMREVIPGVETIRRKIQEYLEW
jgi:2-oxoisovalerate dehydrogenase E1 component